MKSSQKKGNVLEDTKSKSGLTKEAPNINAPLLPSLTRKTSATSFDYRTFIKVSHGGLFLICIRLIYSCINTL